MQSNIDQSIYELQNEREREREREKESENEKRIV